MSNELFLDTTILVVEIAILVIVALESYFAIVAALKSRRKSRRNAVNLKSVLNFVTPDGVLSTKPLTIPVKRTRPLKIREI